MSSTSSISSTQDTKRQDPQSLSEGEIDERRSSYWALINATLYQQFPRFVTNVRNQWAEQRELGRAAVLEFAEGERAVATNFNGSEDLHKYLNDHQQQEPSCEERIRRRLWILEDLSRNYIEILGSALRIPPSFFAAHWADPIGADFNERDSFTSNPRRSFLLKWPQFHRISIDWPAGDLTCAMTCNVERHVFFSDQEDTTYENPHFARMYHNMSYWSSEFRGGSWDAVLLVDPPPTRSVMVLPTRQIRELNLQPDREWYSEKQPPYPAFANPEIINEDFLEWTVPCRAPGMISMFDDLISLQDGQHHHVNEDPRSCTSICRKIVIAMWIGFVRRRFLNLLSVNTLVSVNRSETDFLSRASWAKRGWDSGWQKGIFSNLVNARFKLDIIRTEVAGNMVALGLGSPTVNAVGHAHTEEWEKAGWESVLRLTSTVQQMVEIFTQSYSQAASIQEAKTTNDLTRSVNKITTLATLFLPISLISGFFSMGGPYLPGESRWWVFWAVSCPVIALIFFLTFTNAVQFIRPLPRKIVGHCVAHELPLYGGKGS